MALSQNINDLEKAKFVDASGETAVRVTGSNFSGTFTPSGLTTGGKFTEVTIGNSSWTALPATALVGRNGLAIQNRSGQEIKLNFDNTVAGYSGIIVPNNGERFYDITDSIILYAKSSTSSCTVGVEELA